MYVRFNDSIKMIL